MDASCPNCEGEVRQMSKHEWTLQLRGHSRNRRGLLSTANRATLARGCPPAPLPALSAHLFRRQPRGLPKPFDDSKQEPGTRDQVDLHGDGDNELNHLHGVSPQFSIK
eukprot:1287927-Prymnesium_polylepis.1